VRHFLACDGLFIAHCNITVGRPLAVKFDELTSVHSFPIHLGGTQTVRPNKTTSFFDYRPLIAASPRLTRSSVT